MIRSIQLVFLIFCALVRANPLVHTSVTTNNITESKTPDSFIELQVLDKPHHLFIGKCTPGLKELHKENVIVNNDGKSHVTAEIKFQVEGPVDIRCVRIMDEAPASQAYPQYLDGGVGENFVVIAVSTVYGKGFHFYVEILGHDLKKED
ncbi:PREDICTED: uncharacterized protein LOC108558903 [Nicrophorus vespilloides]|uniref:Uncharacterized protein LOC108558903 n=1 Tax=Nicrophorus vespilloides TaxID=110193 RepID=A0ABM1MA49_NICVS|nr:PREDICTED: uncharacterized protein LOC108558903 [Nicrophorus vespilloides]